MRKEQTLTPTPAKVGRGRSAGFQALAVSREGASAHERIRARRKNLFTVAALAALALMADVSTRGAAVLWNAPATITADSDVSTNGTGVFAFCYYGSPPASLNGVSFTAEVAGAITWDSSVTPFANSVPNFAGSTTLSTAYRQVLYGGKYNSPAAPITLMLNNLTVGRQYQI
jgi:hypothetical protein